MKHHQKGFTFIEILVVVTIIALLTSIGIVSYSQFAKQSRDARRKADLEQIRSAVEMYRSNNGFYPKTNPFTFSSCTAPGGLTDTNGVTYLSKAPVDPKCASTPQSTYCYAPSPDGLGTSYTVGAYLEAASGSCTCTGGCGANPCNYCAGPYGQTN